MIGGQCWMAENLRAAHYSNGDTVLNVTDGGEWGDSISAWCNYDNDPGNDVTYGKLYNWYTITGEAARGLCPAGWHLPSDGEWMILETESGIPLGELSYEGFRGADENVGGKLKSTFLWDSPNEGATNETGFSGVPAGFRYNLDGEFSGLGIYGGWWSAPEYGASYAWCRYLTSSNTGIGRDNYGSLKRFGLSVRCLQDAVTGVDVRQPARFTVVPNPVHDGFSLIMTPNIQPVSITLLDATGRNLDTRGVHSDGYLTIEMGATGSGLYFLQVLFADGARVVERVIKE